MIRLPLLTSAIPLALALALTSCSSPSGSGSGNGSTTNRPSFSAPKLPPPGGFPNIFKAYSSTGDSAMMDGWARDFDISGVSFDQRMTATLITRRHVVMANHYKRKVGSKVIFHDRNGKRLERTLTDVRRVHGDVAVGLLNLDTPAGYKIYPLPAPREDYSHLVGQTAVLTDQNRRLFFHEISMAIPRGIAFRYQKENRHGFSKQLIAGDSGNPSFMISGNELVLIETHSTGGGGAGPFYGSPELQKRMQEEITKQSPGYQFRTKSL